MAQGQNITLSRRAALAASAAIPLAALPALALAAPGDDAELLELIRQHRAAVDYTNSLETDEEVDAAGEVEMALFNAVLRFPVRTSAGFMGKLRFYADLLGWDPGDPFDGGMEERGLVAVMEDAERLFGRAQA